MVVCLEIRARSRHRDFGYRPPSSHRRSSGFHEFGPSRRGMHRNIRSASASGLGDIAGPVERRVRIGRNRAHSGQISLQASELCAMAAYSSPRSQPLVLRALTERPVPTVPAASRAESYHARISFSRASAASASTASSEIGVIVEDPLIVGCGAGIVAASPHYGQQCQPSGCGRLSRDPEELATHRRHLPELFVRSRGEHGRLAE